MLTLNIVVQRSVKIRNPTCRVIEAVDQESGARWCVIVICIPDFYPRAANDNQAEDAIKTA